MKKTTFEIKRESTRHGIFIEVEGTDSIQAARKMSALAFELAGSQSIRRVTDPGWWALMFGWACVGFGPARVLRTPLHADRHVVVRVEAGRLAEYRPDWPMVLLTDGGGWVDPRGPAALRHGPSDRELREFADSRGLVVTIEELMRMFDMGVVEWDGRPQDGYRRKLRGAGS